MKPPNGRRPLLRHLQYQSTIKISPHALSETADESSYDPLALGSSKLSGYPKLNCTAAAIVLVLVVTFFLLGIFSTYLRRLANRRHAPPLERPLSSSTASKGVDVAVVRSLPVYPYRCDSTVKIDCPICLTEYEEKEGVKVIPFCRHMFHPHCIDTWLFSHVSCPVCRSTRFFVEKVDVDFGELGGRSRVRDGDTSVDGETRGVRRISSCSSFNGGVSVSRTSTF